MLPTVCSFSFTRIAILFTTVYNCGEERALLIRFSHRSSFVKKIIYFYCFLLKIQISVALRLWRMEEFNMIIIILTRKWNYIWTFHLTFLAGWFVVWPIYIIKAIENWTEISEKINKMRAFSLRHYFLIWTWWLVI